jgi:hypothetical protein
MKKDFVSSRKVSFQIQEISHILKNLINWKQNFKQKTYLNFLVKIVVRIVDNNATIVTPVLDRLLVDRKHTESDQSKSSIIQQTHQRISQVLFQAFLSSNKCSQPLLKLIELNRKSKINILMSCAALLAAKRSDFSFPPYIQRDWTRLLLIFVSTANLNKIFWQMYFSPPFRLAMRT